MFVHLFMYVFMLIKYYSQILTNTKSFASGISSQFFHVRFQKVQKGGSGPEFWNHSMGLALLKVLLSNLNFPKNDFQPNTISLGGLCQISRFPIPCIFGFRPEKWGLGTNGQVWGQV